MTRCFLLKGDPPLGIPHNELLSLEKKKKEKKKKILSHCPDLTEVREKHVHATCLRKLFRDVFLDSIFDFFKGINVFNKL